MFAVDTNIFIYAHFSEYQQHGKARTFCEGLLKNDKDWCLSWQVVYEYARIVTHPSVHKVPLTFPKALEDMDPYLSARTCHVLLPTTQHRPVLESVVAALPSARGNFLHDVCYAVLLREHGVRRIYTTDSDFKKFDFLDVVDPTMD